jgi:large subunit ribosomal protein L22
MTGTKTNERPGVRAQVKYVRTSAYKAREILDLIRGEQVARALEILEFAERDIARVILKGLESAIANAENNNGMAADELFVSACYADEGPTLKRWRPRAKGRATRIRKRTCHITIIVSRMPDERLAIVQAAEVASGRSGTNRGAAEARRQRVLRSRGAKAERKAAEEEAHDHDHDHDHEGHDHDHDHDDVEAIAETAEAEGIVDQQAAALADEADADATPPTPSTEAEAEGIVDQQGAALAEEADADDDTEKKDS